MIQRKLSAQPGCGAGELPGAQSQLRLSAREFMIFANKYSSLFGCL